MVETDELAIHHDVAESVDLVLRGYEPKREIRKRTDAGVESHIREPEPRPDTEAEAFEVPFAFMGQQLARPKEEDRVHRIFPYGISCDRVQRAIRELHLHAIVTKDPGSADMVITLRAHQRRFRQKVHGASGAVMRYLKSNTYTQVYNCLREVFAQDASSSEEAALEEARQSILRVLAEEGTLELKPQPRHVRRLQHELADTHHLVSRSVGRDPFRRVLISRPGEDD